MHGATIKIPKYPIRRSCSLLVMDEWSEGLSIPEYSKHLPEQVQKYRITAVM